MASAWGDSWGTSWGDSWGATAVAPPVVRFTGGDVGRRNPLVGFVSATEQPDTLVALLVVQKAEFDLVAMDNDFLLLAAA